ncbi:MAG: hypothetical protein IPH75_08100 [bacterium]|nr:hypothetical protein [bacterium]
MQNGDTDDRIRQIKLNLIKAQVEQKAAQRVCGSLAPILRTYGVPECLINLVVADARMADELLFERERNLWLYLLAEATGAEKDRESFKSSFVLRKK